MYRLIRIIAVGLLMATVSAGPAPGAAKKSAVPVAQKPATQQAGSTGTPTAEESAVSAKQQKNVSGHISSAPPAVPSGPAPVIKSQAPSAGSSVDMVPPQENVPVTEPTPMSPGLYEITWQSVNAGGVSSTSPTYEAISSAGQAVVGSASSASYDVGIGYVYGLGGHTDPICDCPFQCDYDADGFLTALDLGGLIDVLFAGRPEEQDPLCPTSRGDFDTDGFPTALDLGNLIDHLFAGKPGPTNPCDQ